MQAQNITDPDQYLKASRIGRETKLAREARKRIWPVFQEYRAQLNEQGKKEYIDLLRDARGLIQSKGISIPYRSVIVDEAQDEIDDLDGGADPQKGYVSLTHGQPPLVRCFRTFAEEIVFLKGHIGELQKEGSPLESVCVVARTKHLVEGYISELQAAGFATYEIKRNAADTAERSLLYVALTRARRSATITGYGALSPFLERNLV